MSRTHRNVLPGDWEDYFEEDMVRGHVSIPKGSRNQNKVWGKRGKAYRKRELSRRRRREEKRNQDY